MNNQLDKAKVEIPYGESKGEVITVTDTDGINLLFAGNKKREVIGYLGHATKCITDIFNGMSEEVEISYLKLSKIFSLKDYLAANTGMELEIVDRLGFCQAVLVTLSNVLEERLERIKETGCSSIIEYNDKCKPDKYSRIIIAIDDIASVIEESNVLPRKDVIRALKNILADGQKAGIHIIAGVDIKILEKFKLLFDRYFVLNSEFFTIKEFTDGVLSECGDIDMLDGISQNVNIERKPAKTGKQLIMNKSDGMKIKVPIMKDEDGNIVDLEISGDKPSILMSASNDNFSDIIKSITGYCYASAPFLNVRNYVLGYGSPNLKHYLNIENLISEINLLNQFTVKHSNIKEIITVEINSYVELETVSKLEALVDKCNGYGEQLIVLITPEVLDKIPHDIVNNFSQFLQLEA